MSTHPETNRSTPATSIDAICPADLKEQQKVQAMLMQAQRVEDIAKLAGGIAHDLNNLLAPIRMASELLQKHSKDPELDRYVEIIQTSTGRARSVIQEILTFSRESEAAECQVMNVNILLRELESITRQTFPDTVKLEFIYQETAPRVNMDPHQLHRSVLNLLVNAKDAIKESGTICVRVSTHEIDVKVIAGERSVVPGRYTCISVIDNGCGIKAEIRDKIFDPFFTTKLKEKGTGLGLASVFGIVTRAGGFVDLESIEGEGSTFHIFLPEAGTRRS